MSRLFRTDLRDDIWDGLSRLAEAEGLSIGVYGKRVLTEHVAAAVEATEPAPPEGAVSKAEWTAVGEWLVETGKVYPPDAQPRTKRGLLTWARQNGFTG